MIKFECKNCGKNVFVEDRSAGGKEQCPLCGNEETVAGEYLSVGNTCAQHRRGEVSDGRDLTDTELAMRIKDPADETDVFPALGQNTQRDVNRPQQSEHRDNLERPDTPFPHTKPSPRRFILYLAVAMGAIILGIAVVVCVSLLGG